MKKLILTLCLLSNIAFHAFATGEPSTYFNIFIPPNNDAVQRNVALIVTAIYDSTTFEIIDDDMDGDSDDSYAGILMAGQSYVLYIKDNGINDDAKYASGGTLKQDGDYFTISSNKLVYASQSTDSDWQFDYVPSVNKSSVGERFIVYAPKRSSSNRDLNVFAYENNTTVTIKVISTSVHMQTGKNTVNIHQDSVVVQRTLDIGQDIIHHFADGRNVMESGQTYLIESNKPVSVQYGALYQNSRDGGGYVPSSNGSSSGDLFYFTVPYQASKEQEIRIVSWDSNNAVALDRYSNGSWINVENWNLGKTAAGDWVGKEHNATYATVFRISASAGKKVSVFTANWLETGSPGTSDIATMVSSKDGTASGREFLCYMAPPGNEHNVTDPFTGQTFNGSFTHLYLFAKDSVNVTIKDAYTNGQKFSRTYSIAAGRYADCALSLAEWQAIYNGDGNPASGAERPYLHVVSDGNISVMNTNFNDNWMMYFGSSLEQSFGQTSTSSQSQGAPGDTVQVTSDIVLNTQDSITGVSAQVTVGSGALPIASVFTDSTSMSTIDGTIEISSNGSLITFDSLPDFTQNGNYSVVTKVVMLAGENDGSSLGEAAVVTVETAISGMVDGSPQQSITTEGISNLVSDASNLLFSPILSGAMVNTLTDSWNASWVDLDGDGDEDLFVSSQDLNAPNLCYQNNGNGSFTKLNSGAIINNKRKTMATAWADVDNDGDMDALLVNNNHHPLEMYLNDGSGSFAIVTNAGFDVHPGYYHGAAWADVNSDGFVDLMVTNYMPTRFHELYLGQGDGTFVLQSSSEAGQESNYTVAPTWVDYNGDGLMDLFIPNSQGAGNSLFRNEAGKLVKVEASALGLDGGNSVAACWGDVDRDGDFDLFVANSSGERDFFYFNNGDGTFTSDSTLPFSNHGTNTHGCSWLDVDNDMDLDLYLTDDQGAKQLYLQGPNLSFANKLDEIAVTNYGKSYGQAVADYDQDGFLDVFVSTHGNGNDHLWQNNGNSHHFLSVRLIGTVSNRCAIGAKVRVKAGGVWQTSYAHGENGFGSQNSLAQHFGLGTNTLVDTLIIDWPSGFRQIETGISADQFISITESQSALITGSVYFDEDADCELDTNEQRIGRQTLILSPGGKRIFTDAEGNFEFRAAPGIYSIAYEAADYWLASCDISGLVVGSSSAIISGQTIGIEAQAIGADLTVNYGSTAWRRGFKCESVMEVSNRGTADAYGVVVNLQLPVEMELVNADRNWTVGLGNVYIWTIDTLLRGQSISISLHDSVGLSATIGQELTVIAGVQAVQNELDASNNSIQFTDEVVGAIDPNDLLAWPKINERHLAAFVSHHDTITYKIRFQNVGTFAATHVMVRSQIPLGTERESFHMIGSSHDLTYSVDADGNIDWSMRNIHLPDSNSNEAGSHGYILYSVRVSKTALKGQNIVNQALITFDYEEPIATNQSVHKVAPSTSTLGQLEVYPNPVGNAQPVWLKAIENQLGLSPILVQVKISDVQGIQISLQNVNGKRVSIEPQYLNPGIYVISALDVEGNHYSGRLIVQ